MVKDRRQLLIVAVIACVAVLAAGWFLLVSPTRAKAAELHDQAAQQQSANTSLLSQISMLRTLARQLPQQQAEVDKLLQKVPTNADLPALIRQLSDIASKAQVDIAVLTPQRPAPLPGLTGVQGLDLAITAKGDYTQLEEFLLGLESMPRAFLVQGITVTPSTSSVAGATDSGQLNAALNGRVLVRTGAVGASGTSTTGR